MTLDSCINIADKCFMRIALRLARRGLGRTGDNPSVGCVLVRDGEILAMARTSDGGQPHAETNALLRAGQKALGATAYITLEPCIHWGKTPPCSEALIKAGVTRVVLAMNDPDCRVNGGGFAMLTSAGIKVITGVSLVEAQKVIAGYIYRKKIGRPLVTLKLATSLDGCIATAAGSCRWISGSTARARGHLLRAKHDAILIGSGTATADDPELTCRLPGLEAQSPVRVVLDSNLSIAHSAKLVTTAKQVPTWVICGTKTNPKKREKLEACGVTVLPDISDKNSRPAVDVIMSLLAQRGINNLLVEGGATVAGEFIQHKVVDIIALFRSPITIGDGRASLKGLSVMDLQEAPRFVSEGIEKLGADTLEILRRPERLI
ncbi:riboflavin biosynthesis protein RibD [Candidatus Endolissoclinum faulkneri L5]|uniref:Riboflavin biosynthesis protein RibD n=1 Tax=Candidatus Endolissoclinum faulkneri L5 TaxID=1401328 RepID=V9TVJ1_9PROT|nr:bifunctional diaminohydroxyphosphoribosylaminopyrimidine deaminase/5-amino-6-(5-phosphoribosylamino)uracil reductase RibD [Candidatus Endolissoclinum faulkneri]AHC73698.1 riboflavin biosynthesis protein RibD [Candidatus Endolissoclinum faulkneri L5]